MSTFLPGTTYSLKKIRRLLSILPVFLIAAALPAQSTGGESASAMLHRSFDRHFLADPALVSGIFYTDKTPASTEGHPYSGTRDWYTGSVTIAGITYDSLSLRYDICSNELVLNTAGMTSPAVQLALRKNRIGSFTLGSRKFIPVPAASSGMEGWFCEVLADGRNRLLLMQSRKLKILANGTTSFAYEESSRKVLITGDSEIPFRGPRTLFKIYPDLREQLHTLMKKERIAFRGQPDLRDARLVSYCNDLLKEDP